MSASLLNTTADKEAFIRYVWLHYVIYSVHGELEQFRNAHLHMLQMEHLVQDHSEVIWSLLMYTENELTAGLIQDLFKVKYSPKVSNYAKDEQVHELVHRYLMECEGRAIYL